MFFDTIGLRYEYEPEGYKIENAGQYLPDFFLPETEVYIEIKPMINRQTWKRIKKDPQKWLKFSNDIKKRFLYYLGNHFPINLMSFSQCDIRMILLGGSFGGMYS